MKKYLVSLTFLTIFLASSIAFAVCSTELTSSTLVVTGSGSFISIFVNTDGTHAPVINVYSGTDDTGKELIPAWTVTTDPTTDRARMLPFFPKNLVPFSGGLYVKVSNLGTGSFVVYYER